MRALKVAVVAMGLVIIAGTALLVATIVHRIFHPRPGAPAAVQATALPSVPEPAVAASVVLDEPAGTRIVAAGAYGAGLAVTLSGGGPDRVVLLDKALRVIGRITLAH